MLFISRLALRCLILLAGTCAGAASLTLTTEDLPPYNVVSDDLKHVSGTVADKVVEIMRRAGIDYSFAPSGWNRAYTLARTRPATCAFGTARIAPREKLFKWIGPLGSAEWRMYVRDDDYAVGSALDGVGNDIISVYRNDALSLYLHEHGYRTTESDNSENSLAALLAGHAKYWATPRYVALPILQRMDAIDRVRYAFSFGHVDLYLACNRAVDDALVERMQQALKRMEQDGTAQRIDARYLPHDKTR